MQYRFTQMAANVMHYSKEVAAELNHSYARCWKIMM